MPAAKRAPEFLELLSPIRDALYRYARRASWRADISTDILQEAVMTAWREFDRFEKGTNFKAWMFRIVTNTAYRLNKRVARDQRVLSDDSLVDFSAEMERESTWAELLGNEERMRQLLDERLVRALDRLSEVERECLLLRLMEEFTYKEIAATLSLPLGTVMSHVHRARAKLREQLSAIAVELGWAREVV